MRKTTLPLFAALAVTLALAVFGCGGGDKDHKDHKDHDHKDHKHEHKDETKSSKHEHDEKLIALGENSFGSFKVAASREEGAIKAGGEAGINVTVAPTAAAPAPKVVGVRFWIGTQDGKGSVKAKAEIEDPKTPNRWHTHAEVPDPMPAGAKLWVEIEDDKGALTLASFELKP